MRGSLFVANAWARQPMRPMMAARMAQSTVQCEGGVCKLTPPPATEPPPATQPPPVQNPSTPPVVTTEESSFPVVPVVAGVGALLIAAALLGG